MRKLCCSGGIQESASHPTTGLQVLQIIVFMTVVLVLSIYCNRNVIGGKPLALCLYMVNIHFWRCLLPSGYLSVPVYAGDWPMASA